MKNQLEKIANNKTKIVSNLKKLRNKYVASIYDGLIKQKSIREIHREIRRVTSVAGIPYSKSMENYALKLSVKMKKQVDTNMPVILKTDGSLDVAIGLWVFDRFEKTKVYQQTNTISYEVGKKYETDNKDQVIHREVKENRKLEVPRIFYLASSHNDCAEDHLDYQGKVYVDEKWESCITDTSIKLEIRKYINTHNVKTFQWVIGKPVWFITRPNCRHYFKSIDTEEVLNKSVKDLIKNHKMHSKIGKSDTQSYKHPLKKDWYTRENVENIIRKYEERYEYHKSLWEVNKHLQSVKRAMEKDLLMIKKWKEYLQNMKD